ncbi:amidase-like [Ruditapes philippinarum]|uniref:amidase-like n=1 Tax=Ruditapes philippinarum TaxID=129788 RepID=UPI00295BD033|nr:amidase-like [Ruditapes philippinarum]
MADKPGDVGLFRNRAARTPNIAELTDLANEFGLHCEDGELEYYKEHIDETLAASYQIVNDLVAPTLPVKYPRAPGFRPEPEDNVCNAWYWRCDIEGAKDGILKGKTLAIKDNVCVAGVPMMNGSKIMEGYVPDIDATVVTRILDAGGRILGKTNCEHLCFSGSSYTNDTGATLNPFDKARSAGGSSAGSAVAVANGEVDMAIGGDQGGSIRIPASWCGIVGLKPTWGLVPYTGAVPIETTCDHLGPMTRTVRDCAVLLEAIAGFDDGQDPRQPRGLKVPKYTSLLDVKLDGWKIGLLTEGFTDCDADVQSVVRAAAEQLNKAGATVEETSIPLHKHGIAIWSPICTEGAYQCMVRGAGLGYHNKGYYSESMMKKLSQGYKSEPKQLSEIMKLVILFGKYMEKAYGNQFYGRAHNLNMKLTKAYDEALKKYDVIIMPTLPYKAPLLPTKDSTIKERFKNALGMIKNTAPFDSTGHPALTINAGKSEGLPIGMMIIGNQFEDAKVIQVAYAFEQLQGK